MKVPADISLIVRVQVREFTYQESKLAYIAGIKTAINYVRSLVQHDHDQALKQTWGFLIYPKYDSWSPEQVIEEMRKNLPDHAPWLTPEIFYRPDLKECQIYPMAVSQFSEKLMDAFHFLGESSHGMELMRMFDLYLDGLTELLTRFETGVEA